MYYRTFLLFAIHFPGTSVKHCKKLPPCFAIYCNFYISLFSILTSFVSSPIFTTLVTYNYIWQILKNICNLSSLSRLPTGQLFTVSRTGIMSNYPNCQVPATLGPFVEKPHIYKLSRCKAKKVHCPTDCDIIVWEYTRMLMDTGHWSYTIDNWTLSHFVFFNYIFKNSTGDGVCHTILHDMNSFLTKVLSH